ncbi:MAG: hydantoinase/carbamoylase family amidase, partial [Burkholderiales bacterium]|nr:hydantoinase/carbamoylase family amidase [Burkholderiales bacterium]
MTTALRIDNERLLARLDQLATIGQIDGGGCCRLALTDADKAGRDQVVAWMRELGLEVSIDCIGNVFGLRRGTEDLAPVMTGSHIDTVATGGRYDGNLGVLAGLEVVRTLATAGITTRRPLVVAFFTNEEGARFAPDMLGSLVYVGGLALDEALAAVATDGKTLGAELQRIGYAGSAPPGFHRPHAFVELHIEQGPVLAADGITIGAVENLQGISWQEILVAGQSNHAGTTPMRLRHDAGYCAAAIATFMRQLAKEMGGAQVGTVGRIELTPNLINVIASRAKLTADLRNTDEAG